MINYNNNYYLNIINNIINKYYKKYKYLFKIISLDYDDLIQEGYVELIKILKEHNDETEIKKLLYNNFKKRLITLLRHANIESQKYVTILENDYSQEENMDYLALNTKKFLTEEKVIKIIKNITKNKLDYDILYKKLIENKSFKKIAKELSVKGRRGNLTLHGIRYKYNKLLKLLKEKLKKY